MESHKNIACTNKPGSPGLQLYEKLTDDEKNILIAGKEVKIAEALEEFNSTTFCNYLQYLLVLLELPQDISEYAEIEEFQPKVTLILKNWTKLYGEKANLGLLTEQLRNHCSIANKIYKVALAEEKK